MANEKQNNVRILQSTQKKQLPPIAHAVLGFFAGIAFIGAVLMYISLKNNDGNSALPQTHLPQEQAAQSSINSEHAAPSVFSADEDKENEIKYGQHYDGDLMNAFKHEKEEKPLIQNGSPFEKTKLHPPAPAAVKNIPSDLKAKPEASVKKINQTKSIAVTSAIQVQASMAAEQETISPQGSVQVTVTKTLAPMKEPAIIP
ncbi:hypothetical protein [Acinetobacter pragensis]|uniref:Uncharacterized protein n=1 Tax=Acinetobacter pragensis TaxID=1806892 RepID=A0A151XZA9_9GAMM|nr:hypothetical protein [Acinetobacter pragensis]KYQ70949.1 hypothetical protein AZH43_16845 [Acinetobacter pragensis]